MAVILITGAKGQLGNELRVVSGKYFGYDFIFTDIDELDITDLLKTKEFILNKKPDWIVNCAAYNQVDKAEGDFQNALLINSAAVRNIASVIKDSGIRFIHISTDYVFDGMLSSPLREIDPVNPLGIYGKSKLGGEMLALQYQETLIIRTSWLYSSFGNNFVKTMLRLGKEKESLTVVADQVGSPTYAADLAVAIMQIITRVESGQSKYTPGVFHYSNEGACSWFDFASEIMQSAGLSCHIIPITTSAYPTAAVRPAYTVFNKEKIKGEYGIVIPWWKDSLKNCLSLLLSKA